MRIGVLVAAGRGRRMGGTKQLTTWKTPAGRKPLVAAAYDAISSVCDEIVVVLGHDAEAVVKALADRPFHRVDSDPDGEMFSSICAGITAALAIDHNAIIILQPGDHPEVSRATLERLIAESLQHPDKTIMPEYRGRGGHPALIPSKIARMLCEATPSGGLREFWAQHAELCLRLIVDDPSVVLDIDTADQLPCEQNLRKRQVDN